MFDGLSPNPGLTGDVGYVNADTSRAQLYGNYDIGTDVTDVIYSVYAQNEDDLNFLFQRCERVSKPGMHGRFGALFVRLLPRMTKSSMLSPMSCVVKNDRRITSSRELT